LEGRSYAAKHVPTAAAASEGDDPTVLFLMLLQHAREVCQLFGRMKQLCGFDITERAQTELHRKGAAFELVRVASLSLFPSRSPELNACLCRSTLISRR
jgi:hypothetical protein